MMTEKEVLKLRSFIVKLAVGLIIVSAVAVLGLIAFDLGRQLGFRESVGIYVDG